MLQELLHGLQVATQELLHRQATEGSPLPDLPDPFQEAQRLLIKLGPHDDIKSEQATLWENCAKAEWAQVLAPTNGRGTMGLSLSSPVVFS